MTARAWTLRLWMGVCGCSEVEPAAEPTTIPPSEGPTIPADTDAPCTTQWYVTVERAVGVVDAEGHGPDPGSTEWGHAVERRLKLTESPDLPATGTTAWCAYIDRSLRAQP